LPKFKRALPAVRLSVVVVTVVVVFVVVALVLVVLVAVTLVVVAVLVSLVVVAVVVSVVVVALVTLVAVVVVVVVVGAKVVSNEVSYKSDTKIVFRQGLHPTPSIETSKGNDCIPVTGWPSKLTDKMPPLRLSWIVWYWLVSNVVAPAKPSPARNSRIHNNASQKTIKHARQAKK